MAEKNAPPAKPGAAAAPANREKKVVTVRLATRLEDIAKNVRCEECGGATVREYLAHAVTGASTVVRAEQVAGYRCVVCGAASFSHQAVAESLRAARDVFQAEGDLSAAHRLDEPLAYHERFLSNGSTVARTARAEAIGAQ